VLAVDILSRLDNGWHDNRDGMNLKQVQRNSFQEKSNSCENVSKSNIKCKQKMRLDKRNRTHIKEDNTIIE